MRLSDSLLLASTKFRARRVRSVLTALASGFMLVVLISASFITTGILNTVRTTQGTDQYWYARGYPAYDSSGQSTSLEEYRQSLGLPDSVSIYPTLFLSGDITTEDGESIEPTSDVREIDGFENTRFTDGGQALNAVDEDLMRQYVADGQSLEANNDQPVPIILSTDYIIASEKIEFNGNTAVNERIDILQSTQQDYLGRQVRVSLFDFSEPIAEEVVQPNSNPEPKMIEFTAKVVGFAPASSFLAGTYSSTLISVSQLNDRELIKGSSINQTQEFVLRFDTQQARNDFVQPCLDDFLNCQDYREYYNDPVASIEQGIKDFLGFFRFVAITLALMVASSMFVTVSKITSDSERETGVFRAIGAKRLDVLQIYMSYAVILAIASFVLAVIIAILIGLYASARYGDSIGFQVADSLGQYSQAQRATLIGINGSQLAQVLGLSLVAALIGAFIPVVRMVLRDPIKAMRSE